MLGLIKKDLLIMGKNFSPIYLLSLLAILIPMLQKSQFLMMIFSLIITLLLANQILVILGLDESANWHKNVTTMPITAKTEVLSKYILSGMFA